MRRGRRLLAFLLAGLLLAPAVAAALPQAPDLLPQPQPEGGEEGEEAPEGEEAEGAEGGTAPASLFRGPIHDPETWSKLGERLLFKMVDFLPLLFAALVILAAFYATYRALARLLTGLIRRTRADPALQTILVGLLKYALMGLGLVMAASQLGIRVGSLLAGLGVAGLALGLAAQDTLANVVAGLVILWDRPFRIGDNVTIAGTYGRVMEIGLRTTRIRTVERLDAILPNKDVIDEKIINHTLNPQLRLGVPVSVAYKEDTRRARQVLLEAVSGHRLMAEDPAPQVVVKELADSGVNLELRVWLRDPYTEREALFEFTELAKIALDGAGIEIPFPQRTLHFPDGRLPVEIREGGGAEAPGGAAFRPGR